MTPRTPAELAERARQIASGTGCTNGFIDGICSQSDEPLSEWCSECVLGALASALLTASPAAPEGETRCNDRPGGPPGNGYRACAACNGTGRRPDEGRR